MLGYDVSDAVVENIFIRNSDDGVCMKSGLDGFGLNLAIPTEDVLVRNITCDDAGRGGFAIGSEMSGGVTNVRVSNCTLWDSTAGVHVKSGRGRGGLAFTERRTPVWLEPTAAAAAARY